LIEANYQPPTRKRNLVFLATISRQFGPALDRQPSGTANFFHIFHGVADECAQAAISACGVRRGVRRGLADHLGLEILRGEFTRDNDHSQLDQVGGSACMGY